MKNKLLIIGIIAILVIAISVGVWAQSLPAEVWVDDNYTVSNCGGHTWGYDAFATIQNGIDGVAESGTVSVAAGTYDEHLIIHTPNINLIGEDKESTIIDAMQDLSWSSAKAGILIEGSKTGQLGASNVTISGFTIRNAELEGEGTLFHGLWECLGGASGIQIYGSSGNKIENNIIEKCGYQIWILAEWAGAGYSNSENNTISQNVIRDSAQRAIYLYSDNSICVINTTVSNNTISDTRDDFGPSAGIYICGKVTDTLIENNTITNCKDGIKTWNDPSYYSNSLMNHTSIIGNNITHSRGCGILLQNGSYNTVSDNILEYNGGGGIQIHYDSNSIITETTIRENPKGGILLTACENTTVTGNNIFDNNGIREIGIIVHSIYGLTTGLVVNNNNIYGHTEYGIQVMDGAVSSPVDATHNWWGDASGPGEVGPGTGDKVSDNVDYDPWYTDEDKTTLSNEANINSYKFEAAKNTALSSDVIGTIDSGSYSVSLTVPYGTDVTDLVATFTLSNGATAKIGETDQVSGTTANDFSSSATYAITSLDGTTTQDWSVTVATTAPGTDPTLSDLILSAGTLNPTFASDTTSYTAAVANNITSITVTPTAADSTATIKVNDVTVASGATSAPISLSVEDNSISIVVTAEDSTPKTYTITVTRAASSDATLSNLSLSTGTLVPDFNSGTFSYTASVANNITSITVTPTAADSTATIKVNDVTVASGATSAPISLSVEDNSISIVITAEDSTPKTYTITVTRAASSDATLSNLTVDGETVSGFSPSTLTYNKVLPYGTTEVPTVAANTTDSNATKVITQATNLTGTEAQRTATVVVTAEDGTTTKTYKVIFGSIKVTITKTGPTTANQGNNITYTITYKNVGTYKATGVVITETYPSEVEFVSANPLPDIGNNQWNIGDLVPGEEKTITVTVHIK